MKTNVKIGILCALFFTLGIFGGLCIPYCLFSKCESIYQICHHVFWDWTLRVLQVVGTLSAVIVALFKEWFYKQIIHPNICFVNKSQEIELKIKADRTTVDKYYAKFDICNNGSASAENCQLYITSIRYLNSPSDFQIIGEEHPVIWDDGDKKVDIPEGFSKSIEWLSIYPEQKGSKASERIPVNLMIGGYTIPQEYHNGKFEITFKLICRSTTTQELKIELEWNGKCELHQQNMIKNINFSLPQTKK
jgi:hypothetical protein